MEYQRLLALCKRRGFLWPSYDIYGGTAGFFDYGPMGAQLKLNMENIFRRFYVIGEGFEEIFCPHVAPEVVFRASGHLSEFSDLMVECKKCSEPFRADHLLEGLVENADGLSAEVMDAKIKEHGVKCPVCGGELSAPVPFNLMFRTNIGPGGKKVGYLRPETAQGMFLNFQNLYRHAREKLPFGIIQVGSVFRNEISPRQGMIRLREFNQAEVEVFVHPDEKGHPNFGIVADDVLHLVPAEGEAGEYTVKEALEKDLIKSEIVAYHVALTGRYLIEVGIDPKRLRFRQHGSDEMAHYASDCWDAEAETSFGWIELVGIADRGCYDLEAHTTGSGQDLKAFVRYDEPKEVREERVIAHPKVLGPIFKKDAQAVRTAIEALSPDKIEPGIPLKLNIDGEREVEVPVEAFEVIWRELRISGDRITPHVIEPSYGMDRIIYAVLEHAHDVVAKKEGEYTTLRLRPEVAPIKVGVFPLVAKDGLPEMARKLDNSLRFLEIRTCYDQGGTVGKRYARMDEIGTPWCVTIDGDTRTDNKATIRERDTTRQIRVDIDKIPERVLRMLNGVSFDDIGD